MGNADMMGQSKERKQAKKGLGPDGTMSEKLMGTHIAKESIYKWNWD